MLPSTKPTNGRDILSVDEENNPVNGLGGDDDIFGDWFDNRLNGGDGRDLIFGKGGSDVINGGEGNDVIYGGNVGFFAFGGANNDTLVGTDATDILVGGGGNDTLIGGLGDDILEGGAGADWFVYESYYAGSTKTIKDFNAAEGDRIIFLESEYNRDIVMRIQFFRETGSLALSQDETMFIMEGVTSFSEDNHIDFSTIKFPNYDLICTNHLE